MSPHSSEMNFVSGVIFSSAVSDLRQTPELRKCLDKTGDVSWMLFFFFSIVERLTERKFSFGLSENIRALQIDGN